MNAIDRMIDAAVTCTKCGAKGVGTCDCWAPKPKSRPILMSGPMVMAILEGRKTVTRRVIEPQPHPGKYGDRSLIGPDVVGQLGTGDYHVWTPRSGDQRGSTIPLTKSCMYRLWDACPYGASGDQLWVREALRGGRQSFLRYDADDAFVEPVESPRRRAWARRWRKDFEEKVPSIHMPRWASRITLEVTGVRVERLQDISEEDAKAEGAEPKRPAGAAVVVDAPVVLSHVVGFRELWCSISGADSWDANPWVWAISFERVEAKTEAA